MAVLNALRRWLGRGSAEPDPEAQAREEALKARLRERCARFRRLLASNKSALEAMSEVEERLASPRPFGMDSVQAVCTRAVTAVFQMVRELNALSDNAYLPLQEAFERIRAQMEALLEEPPHPEGPLVLPLPLVRLEDMPQVGGKMANLGEVAAHAGLPAPTALPLP